MRSAFPPYCSFKGGEVPFPANWLEELVSEWLDLEGFVISTAIGVPAGPGGRFSPDVVGAKLDGNQLLIRHCEAAMHLIQGPEKEATRYSAKFSQNVQTAVRSHFGEVFGANVTQIGYEKWVITFRPSKQVRDALGERVPDIKIFTLADFVFDKVIPTIKKWRQTPYPQINGSCT
jgi:hypothetical protein